MGLRTDEQGERLELDRIELGIEAYAKFGKGSRSIAQNLDSARSAGRPPSP